MIKSLTPREKDVFRTLDQKHLILFSLIFESPSNLSHLKFHLLYSLTLERLYLEDPHTHDGHIEMSRKMLTIGPRGEGRRKECARVDSI